MWTSLLLMKMMFKGPRLRPPKYPKHTYSINQCFSQLLSKKPKAEVRLYVHTGKQQM